MAHRLIVQIAMVGSRVVGRAFVEAYRQAAATQRHTAQGGSSGVGSGRSLAASGLTLDEACKILNVSPPKADKADLEQITERFQRLFDLNKPEQGGSFYLQSKILRARERIEMEVGQKEAVAQQRKKNPAESVKDAR
ncbi:MAG: mitochondrial import inner membrane translocase subunit TIM16 [Lichina confinis]|nr:MAG: mitochondrial import inner membrane translocase subunit TIM16 [Lichina confinis]